MTAMDQEREKQPAIVDIFGWILEEFCLKLYASNPKSTGISQFQQKNATGLMLKLGLFIWIMLD